MNCWRVSVDKPESYNSREPNCREVPHTSVSCSTSSSSRSSQWILEKNLPVFLPGKGNRNHLLCWNKPKHSVLHKAHFQEKLLYQSLTCWGFYQTPIPLLGEKKYPNPAPSGLQHGEQKQTTSSPVDISSNRGGEEAQVKFTVQENRFTRRMRPHQDYRMLSLPHTLHYISSGQFTGILFF